MSPAPPRSSTNATSADQPLLATKLFAPRLRDRMVHRSALLSTLEQASGLVLVSAPAGFGKSTLLADWLQQPEIRSAWLSLEAADDDLRRFLQYLAAALGQLDRALSDAVAPYLQAPQLPSADVLLNPLLNELSKASWNESPSTSKASQRRVVVLDDYHVIENPAVHSLVQHWIEHLPPHFDLVLSTRVDPPFSVSRWRGQGRLTELRADDLRFSEEESQRFLFDVMDLEVAPHLTSTLQECTEGWAVGLQLAALSMRGRTDVASLVNAFAGSHRYVLDYLTDEVLDRQEEDILDFLLRVSPLERFNASLCDALLNRQDSDAMLARLEAQNLFLIPLDEDRRWFRFHHLFRQLLERQLTSRIDATERRALRLEACDWLMERGLADEALGQALAADDRDRALTVLERFAEQTLQQGDAAAVMRWFDRVPLEWIEECPGLPLTRALALFLGVHWSELEAWAPRLQELMSRQLDQATEGRSLTLTACSATMMANPQVAIGAARRALELLPPEDSLLRGVAAITLGVSLVQCSQFDEAKTAFAEAARSSKQGDPLGLEATGSYYEGRIDLIRGRADEAYSRHRQSWSQGSQLAVPLPMSSLALVGQAEVLFEWGDLQRAENLVQKAIAVNRGCFPFNELRARLLLVDIARARRRFAGSLAAAETMNALMQHAALKPWEASTEVHRMRTLALQAQLQDDRQAASAWSEWGRQLALEGTEDLESKLLPEDPPAAAVALGIRELLWRGAHDLALHKARRLRTMAEARQWHRTAIECSLLEARALVSESSEEARKALIRAFERAERGCFVQVIGDDREWLRSLPDEIRAPALDSCSARFRTRIVAALEVGIGANQPATSEEPSTPTGDVQLPELLSQRELEVLREVASGGTNAMVGEALFISPRTVKKHLENIYGKLDVHNRVEAIHRARKLGILDPSPDSKAVSSPPGRSMS